MLGVTRHEMMNGIETQYPDTKARYWPMAMVSRAFGRREHLHRLAHFFNLRISRVSSGVATASPRFSMIDTALSTNCPLVANTPRER